MTQEGYTAGNSICTPPVTVEDSYTRAYVCSQGNTLPPAPSGRAWYFFLRRRLSDSTFEHHSSHTTIDADPDNIFGVDRRGIVNNSAAANRRGGSTVLEGANACNLRFFTPPTGAALEANYPYSWVCRDRKRLPTTDRGVPVNIDWFMEIQSSGSPMFFWVDAITNYGDVGDLVVPVTPSGTIGTSSYDPRGRYVDYKGTSVCNLPEELLKPPEPEPTTCNPPSGFLTRWFRRSDGYFRPRGRNSPQRDTLPNPPRGPCGWFYWTSFQPGQRFSTSGYELLDTNVVAGNNNIWTSPDGISYRVRRVNQYGSFI